MTRADVDIGSGADSPQRARRAVTQLLAGGGFDPVIVGDAVLAVSEVVTNAIVHGGGVVSFSADLVDGDLTVAVTDPDQRSTLVSVQPVDPGRLGGRGLRVVDALVDDWGVRTDGRPGKIVWFRINVRSGRT